jgi:bifunctional ADP-heptose synthase (sugar kinase/adenylyltransferase)
MAQPTAKDILAASAESRIAPRKRVLMAGLAVLESGEDAFPCTVLDVSSTGARVRVGPERSLPDEFRLVVIRNRTTHKARVMWRRQQVVGVRFEDTHFIDSHLPNELRHIQKLWIESATR